MGGRWDRRILLTGIHAADMESDHEVKERVKMKRSKDDSFLVVDESDDDDPPEKVLSHPYLDNPSKKQKTMPSPRQNDQHQLRQDSECVCVCVCPCVLVWRFKTITVSVCVCVWPCVARARAPRVRSLYTIGCVASLTRGRVQSG